MSFQEFRKLQSVGSRGFCVSVPKKYCKALNLKAHDMLGFSLEDNEIIMRRIEV